MRIYRLRIVASYCLVNNHDRSQFNAILLFDLANSVTTASRSSFSHKSCSMERMAMLFNLLVDLKYSRI